MIFNSLIYRRILAFVFVISFSLISNSIYAQEAELNVDLVIEEPAPVVLEVFPPRPLSPQDELPLAEAMVKRVQQKQPEVFIDQLGSVFLTSIEESVIKDARKGLVTRAPSDMEFDKEQELAGVNAKPTGPREVSLGGVLYVSSNEWAVWINSEKITPKNIPSSIIDIRVSKDTVKLKWFDIQTNQIFPIKLRPHQRFNLDSRIFLPGSK